MNFCLFKLRKKNLLYSMALFVLLGIVAGMAGFEYIDEQSLAAIDSDKIQAPTGNISIVVNVAKRTLELYNDGQIHKKYRVAVGKSDTPTPIGEWSVVWKDYNWGTGFGTRWMGLNVPWGTLLLEYTKNTYISAYNLIDNYLPVIFCIIFFFIKSKWTTYGTLKVIFG